MRLAGRCVAAAAVLVLAGCSAEEPSASVEADVSAEVLQYRRDQTTRAVAVKLTNNGTRDLHVQGLELVSPLFDGASRVNKDSTVPAGRSVDLRLPYGEPVCDVDAAKSYDVRLWLSSEPTSIHGSAGSAVLQRIHDRECDAARALEAAPMMWLDDWRRAGEGESLVMDGVLEVGPVTGGPVQIVELGSTTMFALSSTALPTTVAPGGAAAVPVRFTAQRCDPHAFAESKLGMYFDVRVSIGGDEPLLVTVVPDAAGQEQLLAFALERCSLS